MSHLGRSHCPSSCARPSAWLCTVTCTGTAHVWGMRVHTYFKLQPLCFVQPACSQLLLTANKRSEPESEVITHPRLHTQILRNKQQNNRHHSEQSSPCSVYVPLKLHWVSAACHSTTGVVTTKLRGPQQSSHLKFQTAIVQVLWIINLQCLWSNEICSGTGV